MNSKQICFVAVILVFAAVAAAPPAAGQERTIRVRVAAEQANLRERPDISSAVVQQIPQGTVLEADKKEGEWYLVRYVLEDGGVIAGYIHESLVTVVEGEVAAPVKPVQPVQPPVRGTETRPAAGARPSTAGSAVSRSYPGSTFSFDVSLGGGGVDAADLSDGAQGLADSYAALTGVAASGRTDRLRVAYQASVEAYYHVTPWLAVGAGVEFIRGSNASRVAYSDTLALVDQYLSVRPAVKAVPVKLCVRFYPGSGFYFRGALGYYFATASYKYRHGTPGVPGTWNEWSGSADGHCLGAEGGIGGEWGIARHMAIFAEASFRLARIESLSGTGTTSDSEGASSTVSGSLWYYRSLDANLQNDPIVMVLESRPSEAGVSNVRLATFSLSGTALRAGLRFRF